MHTHGRTQPRATHPDTRCRGSPARSRLGHSPLLFLPRSRGGERGEERGAGSSAARSESEKGPTRGRVGEDAVRAARGRGRQLPALPARRSRLRPPHRPALTRPGPAGAGRDREGPAGTQAGSASGRHQTGPAGTGRDGPAAGGTGQERAPLCAMGSRLSRQSSLEEESIPGEESGPGPGRKEPQRRPEAGGGDFQLASLLLGSEKLPGALRKSSPAPYVRRVGWIREIQATLRQQKRDHAVHILRLLRKDLGLEGTLLNEILYKNATFLNLVDPISHDLLMSLARDLQCPKKDYDPWKSSDRICRQLIYHLTPHSKWHRHSLPRRKPQACLKSSLQKKLSQESVDLSGIPLTARDVHRMAYYLQSNGDGLTTVDLSFTELSDELLRLLMPFLWALPKLTHLSLNGNRLTRATMKELTDAVKDMNKFPSLAWVDLGNNVDVSSMPQPLLVGLRKRLSQQTTLPTIYEALDCDPEPAGGHQPGILEEEAREEEEEAEDDEARKEKETEESAEEKEEEGAGEEVEARGEDVESPWGLADPGPFSQPCCAR
ncbi:leucine-rich repeat-containing protein 75B [Ornithorhynchus anatinus]|uniref:Leucine rich repeat containing 75B n=1 Tax=Ornithorhynchus anatinus TaxID=9258 RepID=F6YDL7_ORNAN|nr:leucine-rich repeat-containing protein 75B [Ornithorhynchus anatinus]